MLHHALQTWQSLQALWEPFLDRFVSEHWREHHLLYLPRAFTSSFYLWQRYYFTKCNPFLLLNLQGKTSFVNLPFTTVQGASVGTRRADFRWRVVRKLSLKDGLCNDAFFSRTLNFLTFSLFSQLRYDKFFVNVIVEFWKTTKVRRLSLSIMYFNIGSNLVVLLSKVFLTLALSVAKYTLASNRSKIIMSLNLLFWLSC